MAKQKIGRPLRSKELTRAEVFAIYEDRRCNIDIAKDYNRDPSNISRIKLGNVYSHFFNEFCMLQKATVIKVDKCLREPKNSIDDAYYYLDTDEENLTLYISTGILLLCFDLNNKKVHIKDNRTIPEKVISITYHKAASYLRKYNMFDIWLREEK